MTKEKGRLNRGLLIVLVVVLVLIAIPVTLFVLPLLSMEMERERELQGREDAVAFAEEHFVPAVSEDATVDVDHFRISVTLPERDLAEVEETMREYETWAQEFTDSVDGAKTPALEILAGEGLAVEFQDRAGHDAIVQALPAADVYAQQGGAVALRALHDEPDALLIGNEDAARDLVSALPGYFVVAAYNDEPLEGSPLQWNPSLHFSFVAPRENFPEVMDARRVADAELAGAGLDYVHVERIVEHPGSDGMGILLDSAGDSRDCLDPAADQTAVDLFERLSRDHRMWQVEVTCDGGNSRAIWPEDRREAN